MRRIRKVKNNKGQGIIEYILLLVVVVTIIMGFSTRIYKPLGNYVKNYVGDYLQCLLETGELPVINDGSEIETECSELFRAGNDFAAGNTSSRSGGSDESDSSRSKSGSSGGGSQSTASGSSGKSRFLSNGSSSSGGMSDGSGQAGSRVSEEKKYTGSTATGSRRISSRIASGGRVIRTIPIEGFGYLQQLKKREKEKTRAIGAIESQESGGRAKKMILKKARTQSKEIDVGEEGFTFGKIFRFFIIAIILILILVVVGGEASSVMKGMD